MIWMRLGTVLLLAVIAAGCPASTPMQVPPGEPQPIASSPPVAPTQSVDPAMVQSMGKQADGAPCFAPDECESGICEGASCDRSQPGSCISATAERNCAEDQIPYCGCDGHSFMASSTCPGEPFLHRGRCGQGDGQ
jgi:hypothetical protein